MKISSKILIGLAVFLVGSLFASNVILKEEYKNPTKWRHFSDYKTVLEQPFKHLKIEGGKNCGRIFISPSDKSEVKVTNRWTNFVLDDTDKYIKNDTLFLKFAETERVNSYIYQDGFIFILTPEIVSIESDYSELELGTFKQKTLDVKLSKNSYLEVSRDFSDLDMLKVSLSGVSHLTFVLNGKKASNNIIKVQRLEVDVRDSSKLYMSLLDIHSLKMTSTPNNEVQLSSGTLQALLKQ